jgi:hypothetical protein
MTPYKIAIAGTGYRNIDTNYEAGDYNINDSFYGGMKLSF